MSNLIQLADRLFRGEISPAEMNPMMVRGDLTEVADGCAFIPAFGNVSVLVAGDDAMLVDSSGPWFAQTLKDELERWTPATVGTAVFTHGHIDHACGLGAVEEDVVSKGGAIKVMAHSNISDRFDRYQLTPGYNSLINSRQFGGAVVWPTHYRYPDETYERSAVVTLGDEDVVLTHGKGETDDHTWVWIPSRRVVCCGDFFIWASPNAGNPQKAQRYPKQWAEALQQMSTLGAEVLLPGHGVPVIGADRVKLVLETTAELLKSIHDQALAMMNAGARLDEIIHSVQAPSDLISQPWLRPIYDEPEFIVHNVWRLYGGWYDGEPANLKPPPPGEVAQELARLAGGAQAIAERASALLDEKEFRLACSLASIAKDAGPHDPYVLAVYKRAFSDRRDAEGSIMSKGIFGWAAETQG